MTKQCGGWSNYETWCVILWLTNDQGDFEFWTDEARRALEEASESPRVKEFGYSAQDAARCNLADLLKERLHETDLLSAQNIYADLLASALDEVDWREIAEHFLPECESAE